VSRYVYEGGFTLESRHVMLGILYKCLLDISRMSGAKQGMQYAVCDAE
jgi:hypothetical protein